MDTVNALMMELHGYGLSNNDIAKMIHTDSVNIRRWDYGYASEEDRMELAELASLCRKLSSKLSNNVGSWFNEAIPGTHTTPLDLYAHSRKDLVLAYASNPDDTSSILDSYDLNWRKHEQDYSMAQDHNGMMVTNQ